MDLRVCDEISNDSEKQNQCYYKLIDRQNRHNQSDVTPLQVWQNKKSQWQQVGYAMQQIQQQNYQQQQLNLQKQQLKMQQL